MKLILKLLLNYILKMVVRSAEVRASTMRFRVQFPHYVISSTSDIRFHLKISTQIFFRVKIAFLGIAAMYQITLYKEYVK